MSKKESILKAAAELLAEKGVHNTPMSAIAKYAGTGMGTIYNYFPTKEVLINELFVSIKRQEQLALSKFKSDQPIKTQFEEYLNTFTDFFLEHPVYFKFMDQIQGSPIITPESRIEARNTVQPLHDLVQKGQEERIIKNVPKEEILLFAGGAMTAYIRWYFNQEKAKKTSIQNQLEMVWDGIKA